MLRSWPLGFVLLVLLPGCSNAPLAGTMDCIFPSRFRPAKTAPDRERERDLEPIRPTDRVPALPPDDPRAPLDPPRSGRDSGGRLGDPLGRELTPRRPDPEPRIRDSDLPLLPPPGGGSGGLSDPLPPPPGAR